MLMFDSILKDINSLLESPKHPAAAMVKMQLRDTATIRSFHISFKTLELAYHTVY